MTASSDVSRARRRHTRWAPAVRLLVGATTIAIASATSVVACGATTSRSTTAPTSVPTTAPTTAPTTFDPSRLGRAVWWSDGRTGTADDVDGDGVVVSFTGAPASRAEDVSCGADYVAVAEETPTEVVVTVHEVLAPDTTDRSATGPTVCRAIGAARVVGVDLAAPVGGRTVRDGSSGETRDLVAGSALVRVGAVPDGFVLRREHVAHLRRDRLVLEERGWSRTWETMAESGVGPLPACVNPVRLLTVSDLPVGELPALADWQVGRGEREVGGSTVRLSESTSDEYRYPVVELVVAGHLVQVKGWSTCPGPTPSFEDLLVVVGSFS